MAILDEIVTADLPSTETELCLPVILPCEPGRGPGGLPTSDNPSYANCDDKWNDNLCPLDLCYYQPFEEGDELYFQNQSQTDWIAVNVTDLDGNPIGTASTNITALPGGGQLASIAFIGAPPDCFTISFDDSRGGTQCSGDYRTPICDEKTFLIRGIYEDGDKDCFGNVYPFENAIRLRGYLFEGKEAVIKKTQFGDIIKKREVEYYWTLAINELLPPYIHRILAKQILPANEVQIEFEGKTYNFVTDLNYTLSSIQVKNRMFKYDIRLKDVCKVAASC